MDRLPEDPSPEDGVPDEPVSPYGPAEPAAPAAPADPAVPPPYEPPTPPAPGEDPVRAEAVPPPSAPPSPYGQALPPAYEAATPFVAPPPAAKAEGPGVGAGVATGCGIQVLAVIAFFLSLGIATFFGALWPFILVTVGAAALMFSRRWRRFATGILIVSAATWIIVIGPCIGLLTAGSWMG